MKTDKNKQDCLFFIKKGKAMHKWLWVKIAVALAEQIFTPLLPKLVCNGIIFKLI